MAKAFLDVSVLIGLVFLHAGERAACANALPEDGSVCSRYVIFEVARGFLRSLILLHNTSYEFDRYSDLHQAAYSGQSRFKPYRMATWLGAMTDFQAELEVEDGVIPENHLRHIAGTTQGSSFEGKKCHECGDALICLEAPAGHSIATKNKNHFEPIAAFLGIPLLIATTSKTTGGCEESL